MDIHSFWRWYTRSCLSSLTSVGLMSTLCSVLQKEAQPHPITNCFGVYSNFPQGNPVVTYFRLSSDLFSASFSHCSIAVSFSLFKFQTAFQKKKKQTCLSWFAKVWFNHLSLLMSCKSIRNCKLLQILQTTLLTKSYVFSSWMVIFQQFVTVSF